MAAACWTTRPARTPCHRRLLGRSCTGQVPWVTSSGRVETAGSATAGQTGEGARAAVRWVPSSVPGSPSGHTWRKPSLILTLAGGGGGASGCRSCSGARLLGVQAGNGLFDRGRSCSWCSRVAASRATAPQATTAEILPARRSRAAARRTCASSAASARCGTSSRSALMQMPRASASLGNRHRRSADH